MPDFALIAGILELNIESPQIRNTIKLAYEANIEVGFINDIQLNHKVTAELRLTKESQTFVIAYQVMDNKLTIHSINNQILNESIK